MSRIPWVCNKCENRLTSVWLALMTSRYLVNEYVSPLAPDFFLHTRVVFQYLKWQHEHVSVVHQLSRQTLRLTLPKHLVLPVLLGYVQLSPVARSHRSSNCLLVVLLSLQSESELASPRKGIASGRQVGKLEGLELWCEICTESTRVHARLWTHIRSAS